MIAFRHPRHRWAGMRLDRTGFWPVLTLGWWTWDFAPGAIHVRLSSLLKELRTKR